jgi:hypothetical protein
MAKGSGLKTYEYITKLRPNRKMLYSWKTCFDIVCQ